MALGLVLLGAIAMVYPRPGDYIVNVVYPRGGMYADIVARGVVNGRTYVAGRQSAGKEGARIFATENGRTVADKVVPLSFHSLATVYTSAFMGMAVTPDSHGDSVVTLGFAGTADNDQPPERGLMYYRLSKGQVTNVKASAPMATWNVVDLDGGWWTAHVVRETPGAVRVTFTCAGQTVVDGALQSAPLDWAGVRVWSNQSLTCDDVFYVQMVGPAAFGAVKPPTDYVAYFRNPKLTQWKGALSGQGPDEFQYAQPPLLDRRGDTGPS